MLDARLLRTDLEGLKAGLARRGLSGDDLDRAAGLDAESRRLNAERDDVRNQVKALSKRVGQLRGAGDEAGSEAVAAESRALGQTEKELAVRADEVAAELRALLLVTPNVPADDAPDGLTEDESPIVATYGPDPSTFTDHQRVPHWDIGADLGILDLERATRMSGTMFSMFRGPGARLARSLVQFALDRNSDAFEEIRPPTLVSTETLTATGHLPKFADDAYHMERDDLWAIPTAEVPLTSMARDEILVADTLPVRLMAYTPCYRREAGSAGRDTRGLLRVHEFDKVEILAYCSPEQAADVHAELVGRARGALDELGLTHRVKDLCAGDLSLQARRCYDLEVYAPGCDLWLEASSVSWFGDYQARRAQIRYRGASGPALVHTLNGSALAVPRVWAALVETNRQPDGSVAVPEVLQRYMGCAVIPAR